MIFTPIVHVEFSAPQGIKIAPQGRQALKQRYRPWGH